MGSDSIVTLTHSLTHSEGHHSSLRLKGRKLQKIGLAGEMYLWVTIVTPIKLSVSLLTCFCNGR